MPTQTEDAGVAVWLRTPERGVEPRARRWWLIRAVTRVVVIVAVLMAGYFWIESLRPWLGLPTLIVAGLGLIYIVVMPLWRYGVHRWEVTDEAVYARTGWYVRKWQVAPISRIQTVDSTQGPIEQLMGLATLAVTTASAHGAIYISGINQQIAAEAAQHLTQITELTDGDQT